MHRTRRGAAGDRAAVFVVRVMEEFRFAGSRGCGDATDGEVIGLGDRCDDRVCEPCSDATCRRTDASAGAEDGASEV